MTGIRLGALRPVAILAAILAACGGDSAGVKVGPPAALTVVAGNAQDGQAGEALPTALAVKVVDAGGQGVSKALVSFTITQGGGTLSQALDTTDTDGVASTKWTVGSSIGSGRVEARA